MKDLKVKIEEEWYKPVEKSFHKLVVDRVEDEDCDPRTGQLESIQRQISNLIDINANLLQIIKIKGLMEDREILDILGFRRDSEKQVTFVE